MFDGIRKVALAILATTVVGAMFGVLIGALAEDYLLWIGVMAGLGAAMGVAPGYGFLTES